MDKIEVFIRNVLSAWTLLLFIQKAASTLFTKSKVKKSAILCCAYGALGVIARCWFTYNIIFIFTLTLLVFATMKTCCIKWLQSICFSVVILCIWLIMLLMWTCVGACIQFLLNSVYTRSGQNSTPNSNATNLHSSQKRCCSFCISSSNASPTFQVQKSIFHQMTKPIQVTVILPLLLAISFSRNDDIHSSISGISNDLIGVIPTIGQ